MKKIMSNAYKIAYFVCLLVSGSSSAMKSLGEKNENASFSTSAYLRPYDHPQKLFVRAVAWGDYDEVAHLICSSDAIDINEEDGMGKDSPLINAVLHNQPEIAKLLIENGADVTLKSYGSTPLHHAAARGKIDVVKVLLTSIPLDERKNIVNAQASILAGAMALNYAKPRPPKDIRKLISQHVINLFVQDHMDRIEKLVSIKNKKDKTASQLALEYENPKVTPHRDQSTPEIHEEIARLLNPNDPSARNRLQKEIEASIRCILFPKS